MYLFKKHIVTCCIMVFIGLVPLAAQADSDSGTGGSPSAAAHLNLRVTIPEFMYFRVGSSGATIDTITFAPTDDIVGDGTAVSGSSTASVRLRSNGGPVTIAESNDNGADDGLVGTGSNRISLTQISTSSSAGTLEAPALSDAGGGTSSPTLNGGNVTNRSAVWSYSYANTDVPEADTYDIEITYTATTL